MVTPRELSEHTRTFNWSHTRGVVEKPKIKVETKVKSSPADFQEWTRTTKRTSKSETTKRRNKDQVSAINKIEITNVGILSLI